MIAVVTGASSGIGAATARALAGDGWRVVLVARRAERLSELVEDIAAAGGVAKAEALDAADGPSVMAMAERVRAEWGEPSLVVNSAGAGEWRFLEETSVAEIVEMIGAPYLAAANISRAFIEGMMAREKGLIIHVGSPASVMPWPGATAYTASRWALRGLHEALCQDLGGTGVRSSLVYFGEVSSEYFEANPGSHEHIPTTEHPGALCRSFVEGCSPTEAGRLLSVPPARHGVGGSYRTRPYPMAHRPHRSPTLTLTHPRRAWDLGLVAWGSPGESRCNGSSLKPQASSPSFSCYI